MKFNPPQIFHFLDDGFTPNNHWPVLLYKKAFTSTNCSEELERIFQKNNWTNNWRDVVMSVDHYHSTTHEVLGIGRGSVDLFIGGENGQTLKCKVGDVLVLPAGVAHREIAGSPDYLVVGGYPDGMDWDMIYCEKEKYASAKTQIEALSIPSTDPLFGSQNGLPTIWF